MISWAQRSGMHLCWHPTRFAALIGFLLLSQWAPCRAQLAPAPAPVSSQPALAPSDSSPGSNSTIAAYAQVQALTAADNSTKNASVYDAYFQAKYTAHQNQPGFNAYASQPCDSTFSPITLPPLQQCGSNSSNTSYDSTTGAHTTCCGPKIAFR